MCGVSRVLHEHVTHACSVYAQLPLLKHSTSDSDPQSNFSPRLQSHSYWVQASSSSWEKSPVFKNQDPRIVSTAVLSLSHAKLFLNGDPLWAPQKSQVGNSSSSLL